MKGFKSLTTLMFMLGLCLCQEMDDAFMGVGLQNSTDPEGVQITSIDRHTPAEIAGFELNDVIVEIDGLPIPDRAALTELLFLKNPGDRIKVTFNRCGRIINKYIVLGRRGDYQRLMRLGGREHFFTAAEQIMPHWEKDSTAALVLKTLKKGKLTNQYNKISECYKKEMDTYRGFFTLNAVSLALLEPAAGFAAAERVKEQLNLKSADPLAIWSGVPYVLDTKPIEDKNVISELHFESEKFKPLAMTIDMIVDAVYNANKHIDRAFSTLNEDEKSLIADIPPFLLDIFSETVYIHTDQNEELVDSYEELIAAAKKIDYSELLSAGYILAGIYDVDLLATLSAVEAGEGADAERDILIDKMVKVGERDSLNVKIPVMGRLIVTGEKGMMYTEQAAIWIDLGGDDTYFGYCGGTPYVLFDNYKHRFDSGRIGVHIDLSGNDTYIRNTPGSIGSGLCGGGCLIDLAGNDRYSGSRLCQGSAFCGVGMLIDHAGNDIYIAQEAVQGFAAFGAGILIDRDGDDVYSGARYAQGVGAPKGLGLLLDNRGDDRYISAFKIPNGYGNIDSWDSWSQGLGIGFRMLAAGGIGILCDRSGNDYYEAGNFSQACGYFFGMGTFDDGSGDDIVIGNRYTQGGGVHQAVAVFVDHAGNDTYLGREAINQGGAWDIVSAWFVDYSGNDSYTGVTYSQGGAAQNGFAVFIDYDGIDEYKSGNCSNGGGGANNYHPEYDAKSLGVSIDLGGDEDDYSETKDERINNKLIVPEYEKEINGSGVFWDR